MLATIVSILNGLSAIKGLADLVMKAAGAVAYWYVITVDNKTATSISDAAALASRAKTKEDRIASLAKWREALSRPRMTE